MRHRAPRLATFALIAAALSGCAGTDLAPPRPAEAPAYYAAQAGIAVDLYCQTPDIRRHRELRETNPLLSNQPSRGEAAAYGAAAILATHALYVVLREVKPGWERRLVQGVTALQVGVVAHNARNGVNCW